jgi:hypothetical protein
MRGISSVQLVQLLKQNQFGFTFGGPVIFPRYNKSRNKTFFFLSEDWRKRSNPTVSTTATDRGHANRRLWRGDGSARTATA